MTCDEHDHVTTSNERIPLLLLYIESEEKGGVLRAKRNAGEPSHLNAKIMEGGARRCNWNEPIIMSHTIM